MKGKLTLAAVAVAFAMMSVPGTASAGFGRSDWCKRDSFWGWMHRDRCKKAVVYKKKHHVVKKAKKKPAK